MAVLRIFQINYISNSIRLVPRHVPCSYVTRKTGTYRHIPGDGSPEPEDLPGQEPPHEADAVRRLVVARDGDVDELKQFVIEVLAFS
jgi:hypothetical protein